MLETLEAQYVAEKLLTEEQLWDKAMAHVEETRQHDMQELREQIKSLAQHD